MALQSRWPSKEVAVNDSQANEKAMSLYWALVISSLPITPSESEREVAFLLGSVGI